MTPSDTLTTAIPLQIANLTATHGAGPIFEELSLTVRPGEVFGLVGLNGEGKTTLIKTCLNLMDAKRGNVAFFGCSNQTPESRRKVAYLPEKFMPPRSLRGHEFLRLILGFHGVVSDADQVREMAGLLDMDPERLSHRVSGYSKGMGQKLGLLATLLTGCPLLMLDEPMSGLDPMARISLKQQILDYRAFGHTVFLSSHILIDLDELCDRIGILHGGKLVFVGPPGDLKQKTSENDLEKAFLSSIGKVAPAEPSPVRG